MTAALKGIGYDGPKRINQLDTAAGPLGWYYDWGRQPSTQATYPTKPAAPFVPMIWGRGSLDAGGVAEVLAGLPATGAKECLGFNEPDHPGQSNMTPRQAADRWPELHALGLRLGSPATVSPGAAWLDEFMEIANSEKLRVDFMAVHSYSSPDAADFLGKIDSLYARWKRPVWVTEYAAADFTVAADGPKSARFTRAEVNEFMAETVAGLRARPFVERFAWKTRAISDPRMWFSALYQDDGALTSTGQLYASL